MTNHFNDAVISRGRDGAPFLVEADGVRSTYADMRRRAAAMAGALVALGVMPGDRVAAQVEKSTEALMLYLGALRAGAVFLPLNPSYTTGELDYFLRDAEPKVLVCDPTCRREIEAMPVAMSLASVETLDAGGFGSMRDRADAADGAEVPVTRSPDDLAAILYTSGTTGRSKGAMLTHDNLVSNALVLAEAWRLSDADVLLHALPTYHTHGLFVACNTSLAAGASIIFLPKFDADTIIAEMPKATVMMGVPTFYTRLIDRPDFTRETTRSVRLFVSGSAPLLPETHRAWSERTGHAILERYGMTETGMNTSNPYEGDRRPGTVGPALSGIDVRVVDPDSGATLAAGEVGMIEVKGPNVFAGYWRNAEKTKAEFRPDGFFVTGDLGKCDADGYVHIVGRAKDLVISGGLNIYPKEVEVEIDTVAGIKECAVIGLPHRDLGEAVAAIVVRQPGIAVDEAQIATALANRLARFKQPRRVFFADELPRNAMGKVQKNLLRETYKDAFAS